MQPSTSQVPENPMASAQMQASLRTLQLQEAYGAAGSNFYSIAIFSLINSIITYFQGGLNFPIGLAITQIIDGLSYALQQQMPDAGTLFFALGAGLNVIIFAVVALFGFFIKKQKTWLIPVAGALYLLDGVLMLLFQDWIGAAFHAYFLFRVWGRWQTIRSLTQSTTPQSTFGSV